MTPNEINRRLGEYDSALRMVRARHDLSVYRIERKDVSRSVRSPRIYRGQTGVMYRTLTT